MEEDGAKKKTITQIIYRKTVVVNEVYPGHCQENNLIERGRIFDCGVIVHRAYTEC